MHNNYFFLRQLTKELTTLLLNSTIEECFSQQKDELIIIFRKDAERIFLQAHLTANFSCLYFPKDFNRAKRNTASLFSELNNQKITAIIQAENERAFSFTFNSEYSLLFKLFGTRANIILYKKSEPFLLFKNKLNQDWNLKLNQNRAQDLSLESFEKNNWSIKKVLFTLGDLGEKYVLSKGYDEKDDNEKFEIIKSLLESLKNPVFYIVEINGKVSLSLFPLGNVMEEFTSALQALNHFYGAHFRYNHLEQQKQIFRKKLSDEIKSLKGSIAKSETRLQFLMDNTPPEKIADVIMANLHAIPKGLQKVTLFNFYTNEDIEIKLKKDLTPQKNAEVLYRKGKNKHIEESNLLNYITSKTDNLNIALQDLEKLEATGNHKELEYFSKKYSAYKTSASAEEQIFRFCEYEGFKIYVGKSAENNDELTQKFAHKDDLWLHAKDVTGSHVIIRHQSGKTFPKTVLEKAASLAAFYSKRKNDSLCPVQYTQKKYVRKVKGAPKGQVKVEKESVIMVVPSDF